MGTKTDVAALFDLDLTLLRVNSAKEWLKYVWREGEIGVADLLRSGSWLLQYRLAILDLDAVTRRALSRIEGMPEQEMEAKVERWYEQYISDLFYKEALELVEDHRRQGHQLMLATGSSPYISRIVQRQLGLDDYACTHLEVRDGAFTGQPVEPVCYAEGKLHWARSLATRHSFDLSKSYFYTDSFTDLPLLRAVGSPVATNPDPRLRRLASKEGMAIRDFSF